MRGKKDQKIITLLIIIILLVPSISCVSIKQKNEEQLTTKNIVSPQIVTDIVVDENILLIHRGYSNYIFDITNNENPKKRATMDSTSRLFIKNFIHKNKLLSYTRYYDSLNNQKYELQIYDLSKIRNPKLIESIPIESEVNSYMTSFQFIGEEDEVIVYHLEQNGTTIYLEKINLNTYEHQNQINTTEEIFEEKGNLWGIKKRENKAYIAFADENKTLGVGIFTIQEDYQLVKEKIMKSNYTETIHGLDFIVNENFLITRTDTWAHGYGAQQRVYDLTNGENLTKISTLEYKDLGTIQAIENNYLYTLESKNFSIYDITDWENRELIGTCECQYALYKAEISNNYAYVNQGSFFRTNYLAVIDMTNLQEMEVVKIFGTQLVKQDTKFTIMVVASWVGMITGLVAIIMTPILIVRRRKKTKRNSKYELGEKENTKK
ncbi:MAG: hypothetical protein FK730_06525 [Asgard group archaeon]|nr:hypothetical protein [Asgard group archaeon]